MEGPCGPVETRSLKVRHYPTRSTMGRWYCAKDCAGTRQRLLGLHVLTLQAVRPKGRLSNSANDGNTRGYNVLGLPVCAWSAHLRSSGCVEILDCSQGRTRAKDKGQHSTRDQGPLRRIWEWRLAVRLRRMGCRCSCYYRSHLTLGY